MIQTRKMEEGDKTPTLYSFYDDQYDFNDLSRRVDSGLNNYISTLKRGKKYESEIREAVANLMAGVKDGTITFGNGHYNDSLGRYSNAEDKDKDVYGWAANYIYNNMSKSQKYVAPQDTSKKNWSNMALSQALVKDIFNSNQPNIDYFVDQDQLDPETNTRGTAVRAKMITDWIDTKVNDQLFNGYTGYTNEDKQNFIRLAQEASAKLKENGVDPGDYLFLSRAFPGIPWESLFRTGPKQTTQQGEADQGGLTQSGFNEYLDQNWKRMSNDSSSFSLQNTTSKYGEWTQNQLISAIKGMDDQTLANYLVTAINNPNRDFGSEKIFSKANGVPVSSQWLALTILQRMAAEGKLIQDKEKSNIYYIPELLSRDTNSGYYYDDNTKTIYKRSIRDIPYWQDQLWKWYSGDTSEPWTGKYFTTAQYKKNGGIIKAQGGTQLWYSGLSAAGDYDSAKYQYSYDTSRLVDADMSDDKWNPWVSDIAGLGVGRYKPTAGNTRAYTQSIENTQYYKNFGNALLNPDGTFTDVGLAWAKAVDAQLPKGSKATFFDESGNLRTTWAPTTNDTYGRTKRQFNNLADYVNYVRNDQILGSRHNVFLNQGNRYFYKDQNGVEHWVDPNEISKYEVSANPVRSQWNDDNTIYWNDYELTGLKPDQVVPDDQEEVPVDDQRNTGSRVYPIGTQPKTSEFAGSGFGDFMLGITPDLIGAGRLFASLRTNNRVARTLDRSLRPVLKDTYERYSPITGAFGEMSFRNRQAADLRRQASRPFTSDASLQLAGQLEADRQARDLEYQGFLADDKEIKRTQEAALARQEDNMARRSEVSNFNRASINQTNREKAQLEATRLRHNWQSVDNFLQGVEGRLRTSLAERRAIRQNASMQAAQTRYQEFLQRFNEDYKRRHPNATQETMLNDPEYIRTVQDLRRRYQYDTYNIGLGRYYRDPYAGIYDKDNIPTYESILYSKNGGRLRPSIMTMINKVIKNESYT